MTLGHLPLGILTRRNRGPSARWTCGDHEPRRPIPRAEPFQHPRERVRRDRPVPTPRPPGTHAAAARDRGLAARAAHRRRRGPSLPDMPLICQLSRGTPVL